MGGWRAYRSKRQGQPEAYRSTVEGICKKGGHLGISGSPDTGPQMVEAFKKRKAKCRPRKPEAEMNQKRYYYFLSARKTDQ